MYTWTCEVQMCPTPWTVVHGKRGVIAQNSDDVESLLWQSILLTGAVLR